jgi:nitrite reductase (NO-forming)
MTQERYTTHTGRLATGFAAIIIFAFSVAAQAQDKTAMMTKGEKVYKAYCQTCHQANGQGLSTVYPPVANSDYIKANGVKDVIKGVMWGRTGPMTVNGKQFNGVMNPIPANYTDEDIAAVVTYVMNSWGNPGGVTTVEDVKKVRKEGKPGAAGGSKRVKS